MSHNIIDTKAPETKDALVILVDYSNWLYRAFFAGIKDAQIRPWMPFIRALEMMYNCTKTSVETYHKSPTFFFAGDSVRKKLNKMKTDEMYKADRPALTDLNFYIFRNIMNLIVKDIGCDIKYADGYEADELIASCVKQLSEFCDCDGGCKDCPCKKKPHTDIVIFSQDKDLEICLGYKFVEVYKGYGKLYNRSNYISDYGFLPSSHLTYKALVGDKSDNIPPVPSWGESKAKEHILKGDWEELLKKDGIKWQNFLNNIRMMAMDWDIPIENPYGAILNYKNSSEEFYRKMQSDFHDGEAVKDVIFNIQRLVEVSK